jgi:hypothetical protein
LEQTSWPIPTCRLLHRVNQVLIYHKSNVLQSGFQLSLDEGN